MPVKDIRDLFKAYPDALSGIRKSAFEARELIETVSRDIERHTATVCAECTGVCCIDRHSRHDRSDLIFLAALGLDVPEHGSGARETSPCRFLGSRGCRLTRSLRPYRCTWFFCSPLLEHIITASSPPVYRRFTRTLKAVTDKRTGMIDAFEELEQKLSGADLAKS